MPPILCSCMEPTCDPLLSFYFFNFNSFFRASQAKPPFNQSAHPIIMVICALAIYVIYKKNIKILKQLRIRINILYTIITFTIIH